MRTVVPVSAILPTRNRTALLKRFLDSLAQQTTLPAEIVVCDASDDSSTKATVSAEEQAWHDSRITWVYEKANRTGLAPQRNQAVAVATQPFVWFLDDDVILEPMCLEVLHRVATASDSIGGVTATITNQHYSPPGPWVRGLMRFFEDGRERDSYAACCIGPGYTFYPDASPTIAETNPAEWMIGCCSLYRKAALRSPAVPDHFEGGAIGEDLAASLEVAKRWSLLHARDARCFHDSQGGDHKRSLVRIAAQGLVNRYYIMTQVLGKTSARDHLDFAVMLLFGVTSLVSKPSTWVDATRVMLGYVAGVSRLLMRSAQS